jgi:phosphatidylglycerol---prolipoprotein diacylglyceryl transferase
MRGIWVRCIDHETAALAVAGLSSRCYRENAVNLGVLGASAMQQVLFHVPILGWPIYGYGFMLFCAYVGCMWLAVRLARRVGVPKEPIQDLAVWLFITGILGARLTYIVEYWDKFQGWGQFFAVWDGGLVFYGSVFGGLIGYALAYSLQLRKYGVSHWKMLDIIAPCVALGLCLGRFGCLLNGCCFGNVACGHGLAMSFPMSGPPREEMAMRGFQSAAGYLTYPATNQVRAVEPNSAAASAGLKPDDTIERVKAEGKPVVTPDGEPVLMPFERDWPRGERSVELDVRTAAGAAKNIGPFMPLSLALHPTQVYESISMALLLFFLVSYYPYNTRDGALMVLFMFGYGIHRFLNEMLRIDNEVVAFNMTLSQNVSIAVLIGAVILTPIVWRRRQASVANNANNMPAAEPQAAFMADPASTTSS